MGFSGQEYWVGCHCLLQGIFPSQGSNPGLLHYRQTLYHLSYKRYWLIEPGALGTRPSGRSLRSQGYWVCHLNSSVSGRSCKFGVPPTPDGMVLCQRWQRCVSEFPACLPTGVASLPMCSSHPAHLCIFLNYSACGCTTGGERFRCFLWHHFGAFATILCVLIHCISYLIQARVLEWIAIPFSRVSSWPRDRTLVSCIAGRFLTVWATGKPFLIFTEAQIVPSLAKELSSFSLSLTGFDVLLCAEHWGLPDVSCVFHAPQLETAIHTRNSASFSGILYFKTIIEAQKYSLWLGWPLFLFHFC